MSVEKIVGEAATKLAAKTFGGVSKESALEAIKLAAEKARIAGEEAVAKVTQELNAFKGKTAQEMAELTSKKDAVIFQTQNEAKSAIEAAQNKAAQEIKAAKAAARAPKTFEKALPNGNKEIRKFSSNGALMVKEVNKKGITVKYSVTQLDGSIRRTTFNPETGKPIRTYTNVGGESLIEYAEGKPSIAKAVNKKKIRAEKPTLVTQTQPKPCRSERGEAGMQIERVYSDGSKEVVEQYRNCNNNRTTSKKFDSDGYLTESKVAWDNDSKSIRTETFTKDGLASKTESYIAPNGKKIVSTEKYGQKEPGDWGRNVVGGEFSIGKAKIKYTKLKDEFGLYTGQYRIKLSDPSQSPKTQTVVGNKEALEQYRDAIWTRAK